MKQIETVITLKYLNKIMIKKAILLMSISFLALSCKKESYFRRETKESTIILDTSFINLDKCYITMKWDSRKIEEYKKKFNEEDFYIIMDDINYYTDVGLKHLTNTQIDSVNLDLNTVDVINFNNNYYLNLDSILFF